MCTLRRTDHPLLLHDPQCICSLRPAGLTFPSLAPFTGTQQPLNFFDLLVSFILSVPKLRWVLNHISPKMYFCPEQGPPLPFLTFPTHLSQTITTPSSSMAHPSPSLAADDLAACCQTPELLGPQFPALLTYHYCCFVSRG